MGDRVNIAVEDKGKRVWFYGHWSGYDAPEIVREALARKERWNDPSYLARIIFCVMVGNSDNLKGTTGLGVSTEPGDNEYPFLIVNCDKQTVSIEDDNREGFIHCRRKGEGRTYTFTEYAALPAATWGTLDTGRRDEEDGEDSEE